MTSRLPPLVPAYVNLRAFTYMPLDVVRVRDSDIVIEATGEEFRAAFLLWCAAWHQVPAASLPDNDQALAKFAGFGRDLKSWARVRAGALRGFKQCDDGRLYHPVIAEKAIASWEEHLHYRHKRECDRIRKAAQREESKAVYPSFDEWKQHFAMTGDDRWEPAKVSRGTAAGRRREVHRESHPVREGIGREEKGRDKKGSKSKSSSAFDSSPDTHTHHVSEGGEEARACVLMTEAGCKSANPSHEQLRGAIAEGITPEVLRDTALEGIKSGKTNPFAWACVTARKRKATAGNGGSAPGKASKRFTASNKPKVDKPMPKEALDLARRMGVAAT